MKFALPLIFVCSAALAQTVTPAGTPSPDMSAKITLSFVELNSLIENAVQQAFANDREKRAASVIQKYNETFFPPNPAPVPSPPPIK